MPISAEEKYKSIFEHTVEGIFQTTSSGKILDLNPALAKIFRYRSPGEMKKKIKDIPQQIYANREMREKRLRMAEARGHTEFEFQYQRKDKTLGWGMPACVPSAMPGGKPHTTRAFSWTSRTARRWKKNSAKPVILSGGG
jgi:PAS domain S-box-containing protein